VAETWVSPKNYPGVQLVVEEGADVGPDLVGSPDADGVTRLRESVPEVICDLETLADRARKEWAIVCELRCYAKLIEWALGNESVKPRLGTYLEALQRLRRRVAEWGPKQSKQGHRIICQTIELQCHELILRIHLMDPEARRLRQVARKEVKRIRYNDKWRDWKKEDMRKRRKAAKEPEMEPETLAAKATERDWASTSDEELENLLEDHER